MEAEAAAVVESGKDAALRELAEWLRPRARALAERTLALYRTAVPVPPADEDPHLLADMTEVSLAGLECWIDALEHDREVEREVLRPVLEVMRRRASQGAGVDPMMRAYRIATKLVWQEILELPVDRELVARLSTRMLEFTDQLATAAELEYAREAPHGVRGADRTRSADFEAVLAGSPPKHGHTTGWLENVHCVVIARRPQGAAHRPASADLAAVLVREARAVHWTTRADGVVAACLLDDGPGGRDRLIARLAGLLESDRPLGVAVGGAAQGPAGTRQSHREALDAMHVGERLGRAAGHRRIHDSQELGPLAMLVEDPERAERFARAALYPLGRLAERGWVLPTLAAYLKCQGRLKEMAAELAVHPSTVKYRLNELRGFLDAHAADGDQAAALLLAVRAAEYLGRGARPGVVPGT